MIGVEGGRRYGALLDRLFNWSLIRRINKPQFGVCVLGVGKSVIDLYAWQVAKTATTVTITQTIQQR